MAHASATQQASGLTQNESVASIAHSHADMANRNLGALDVTNRHITAFNERTDAPLHLTEQSNNLREGALAFKEKHTPEPNGQ